MSLEDVFKEAEKEKKEKKLEEKKVIPASATPTETPIEVPAEIEASVEALTGETSVPAVPTVPEVPAETVVEEKKETSLEEAFGGEATSISTETTIPQVPVVPTSPVEHVKEKVGGLVEKMETEAEKEFTFEEAKGTGKAVILLYSRKGEGKTTTAMSFGGTIACISFDRKALPIRNLMYPNSQDRIKVYDGLRFMDYSSATAWLESSDKTFKYLNYLISQIEKNPPDWIIIDGVEEFSRTCEMTMRARNNLQPFQGIANRNLWKERRMYIKQIHNRSTAIAKKGVIYTTYINKDEIVREGTMITKKDVPKWIDAILTETDVVIRLWAEQVKGARKFLATVESNKSVQYPMLLTGRTADVTGKGISAFYPAKGD